MSLKLKYTYPALPRTERGQSFVIDCDPLGEKVIYPSSKSVIILGLNDVNVNDIYSQHSTTVTVARYSPSGYYIASADISGKVRIWDTVNEEHILKNEFQPFAGPVRDLCWSGDNQRICLVGEGREKFGAVINAETGTSVGDIGGMSRAGNSASFRNERPFRLVIGSEDYSVCYFEGPPFKLKTAHHIHSNFINVVKYAPSGSFFISGSSDGSLCVFEGKTGERLHHFEKAHNGGIYSLAFSSDSSFLVTVSGGDKCIKMWRICPDDFSLSETALFTLENELANMLLSVAWKGSRVIAGTLSGYLYVFDSEDLSKGPQDVWYGHNKAITVLTRDASNQDIISASSDGKFCLWKDVDAGKNSKSLLGKDSCHSSLVQRALVSGGILYSVGMDDHLLVSNINEQVLLSKTKLNSQPRDICIASSGKIYVLCLKDLAVMNSYDDVVSYKTLPDQCESSALTHDGTFLFLGCKEKGHILRYNTLTNESTDLGVGEPLMNGGVVFMTMSPDGKYLAVADSERFIFVFGLRKSDSGICLERAHSDNWRFHVAKVNCLSWSPNSRFLASGSVDCSIFVSDMERPSARCGKQGAHRNDQVTSLLWLCDSVLVSAAQDGSCKVWDFLE